MILKARKEYSELVLQSIKAKNASKNSEVQFKTIFQSKFIQGVIDLYFALQKNDNSRAIHAYEQWGFKGITKAKLEVLNKWASFIYSPLMKDKIQKIQESDNGIYGASSFGLWQEPLSAVYLNYANLVSTTFVNANLSGASMLSAYLSGSNLSGADISNAYLLHSTFDGAVDNSVGLVIAIPPANLSNTNLSGAYLSGARLQNTNLTGANLSGAILEETQQGTIEIPMYGAANLTGAKLNNADISNAYLSGVILKFAKLINADLSGSDLSNSDLSGSDMTDSNLTNAVLSNVIWHYTTCPDGTDSHDNGYTCMNNL